MKEERHTGKIKFYIDKELYGFLIDDRTGEEYYVPVAGLIDEIRKNDRVSYRLIEGNKGKEAVDVRLIS
jgi:CspA family cold shock protein